MAITETELAGLRVAALDADGPLLETEAQINDFIGDLLWSGAELAIVPVSRLAPDFFRLSTGLAGTVTQKFVNYHQRVAFVGDISEHLARSAPLRDYVRECNAGRHVSFACSHEELAQLLAAGSR